MKKNYYDILQVNKNASPIIIEKAYKTLAKMYHPDLQTEDKKKRAEEIFKQINEAYETLSDLEKKKNYDASLEKEEPNHSSKATAKQNYNTDSSPHTTNTISIRELRDRQEKERLRLKKLEQTKLYQEELQHIQEQLQQAKEQAYHDAYFQTLKNFGYKIYYKKSLKDYIKGILHFILVLLTLFLLWHIPFIQNFILDFIQKYTFFSK